MPPLDFKELENFNNSDSNIENDNSVVILQSEKNGIKIYPNPNTGVFNIENNNDVFRVFSIKVINIMGKTVYHKESISAGKTKINIKSQQKGIYFVKVMANGKIITKKMVYL